MSENADLSATAELRPESHVASPPVWQRLVGWFAPILLGAILLFSAWTKMIAPKAFVATIDAYGLFPSKFSLLAATGVVALEFALGAMLLTGILRRLAAWLTLPLLVFFLGLVVYATRVGLESCGCFGEVVKIPPALEIVIDAALLVLLGFVLWLGRSLALGPRALQQGFAWAALGLGAALFLAGNPASTEGEGLAVELTDLSILVEAEPPLSLPGEAFVFLFSADCDHCWAYAPGVEIMHRRLEGLEVVGVTYSDPQALEEFREVFGSTFPIHILSESQFAELTREYPAGIWLHQGKIEKTWSGFIPSHWELSQVGGYTMREDPPAAPPEALGGAGEIPDPALGEQSLFGGPVRSRHN